MTLDTQPSLVVRRYIKERLEVIENIAINFETWRDYVKAWESLLELRSKVLVERGQSIPGHVSRD
jgi:hypothetical protein